MLPVLVNRQSVGFLSGDLIQTHSYFTGLGRPVPAGAEKESLSFLPTLPLRRLLEGESPVIDEIRKLWIQLGIPHDGKKSFFQLPTIIKNDQGIELKNVREGDMILLQHYEEGKFGHNRQTLLIQERVNSRNNISLGSLKSRLQDPAYKILRIDRSQPDTFLERNSIVKDEEGKFYAYAESGSLFSFEDKVNIPIHSFDSKDTLEKVSPVPSRIEEQVRELL